MAVDASVQVAIVSVFSTTIATLGVVAAAFLNNRREREKLHHVGVEKEDEPDNRDFAERLLALIDEVQRKEVIIVRLRRRIRELLSEIRILKAQVRDLRNKNEGE